MMDETDKLIDSLLCEQFEGPVPDEGFCERVMEQLPASKKRRNWPLVAGAVTGVVTSWILLGRSPVTQTGWRDWLSGDLSASAITLFIAVTGLAILTMVWTIAEADEQLALPSRRVVG